MVAEDGFAGCGFADHLSIVRLHVAALVQRHGSHHSRVQNDPTHRGQWRTPSVCREPSGFCSHLRQVAALHADSQAYAHLWICKRLQVSPGRRKPRSRRFPCSKIGFCEVWHAWGPHILVVQHSELSGGGIGSAGSGSCVASHPFLSAGRPVSPAIQ